MVLSTHASRPILYWLLFTAFMVFAMAVIGAITRLTESGLSMVEWKPFIGAIPPLSEEEWNRVFDLYKSTPEFLQKNSWMELADFKNIFFWEWLHRLWGRLIGLAFALPLAVFWIKNMIPKGYKGKFLAVLFLGAAQGFLGWFMVMSGLIDRPDVSHFRLAAHLLLALFIFAVLLWLAFDFMPAQNRGGSFCQKRHGWIALGFLSLTILWGAFTAGLDGGKVYNTWPMMNTHWIPPEVTGWKAILNDPAAVQFFRRWIAIITFAAVIAFAIRLKNIPLAGMMLLQVALGIITVLLQAYTPVAALHQAGAMILLALMVRQLHSLHSA